MKKTLTASKDIKNKIPYTRCFEEEGMFETVPGTYTKAYVIKDMSANKASGMMASFNMDVLTKNFANLLNEIPGDMNFQFLIHNRLIPQEDFLRKVLVVPDKEEEVNGWIDKYNECLTANSLIGHNNVKKNKYFVLSCKAARPEDAISAFKLCEEKIKDLFLGIYGLEVESMSTADRLKCMYSMFNPNKHEFGKIADLRGDGVFSLKDMTKLRLSSKDCIAPDLWDASQKNYMRIGDCYVRTFFVASMPTVLSNSIISEITNISSNMVLSVIYEPVEAKKGFEITTEAVSGNTVVREVNKKDTLKDRKEKAVIKTESLIRQDERAYFERSALRTFKEAVAMGEKTMLTSIVIALYADDLDTLERDTRLLHISMSKFACQVKTLDLQQIFGFWAVLPLCISNVDVHRMFTVSKLSTIPPINLQEVIQRDGLYTGLNAINDSLILLNRKNSRNLSGLIAGTEHSGKTFQMKREVFNALISGKDRMFIITETDEYNPFVLRLGGQIMDKADLPINPFIMMEHYGLINPDKYSKGLMLEALIWSIAGDKAGSIRHEDTGFEREDSISAEIEVLLKSDICISDIDALISFLTENTADFPILSSLTDKFATYKMTAPVPIDKSKRLHLIKVHSTEEKIVLMDFLFNYAMTDKMQNTTDWIFIDSVDDLISSEQTEAFFLDYIEKMNALQDVLTFVIQSSVRLFSDNPTALRLEDVVNATGYFKLLNQGAIERKEYARILNISNGLTNYITSAELGKGVILTAASNFAFDDGAGDEEFYELFK